ncbi:membrane protein of unknown function [Methanoculleus bourgensis]|uniref:Major facilitator superfamily (MFS) profile domain-containing protein n=1 Tax=Methanoculleus bourgensis TaxID=83986 RepID=A0A0X3BJ28_9EURY|nr:membrane protein of unknown function [Methanoculleus bourgensis]
MHRSPGSVRKTQKYLGDRGLVVLIALLSAFVPLSTDLYLPALPGMGDYFGVSAGLTNLTLILFFLFFSLGLLFWGPLSDKYGRRPVLLAGLALYIAASIGCAASLAIWHLIAFRILQAVGGSAAAAVATAMVKDSTTGGRGSQSLRSSSRWSSSRPPSPRSSGRSCSPTHRGGASSWCLPLSGSSRWSAASSSRRPSPRGMPAP